MLKKIAIGVAVVIVALLLFAVTKPDTFSVERTATISAPPSAIFPHINNFHNWNTWSPWEKLDPDMERTYEGAESGEGAVYTWSGNSDVGSGRMEIVESNEPSNVTIRLNFTAPFEAENMTEFRLQPEGDATTVTWAMHGSNNYVSKLMSVFVSMDSMIGSDFEKGLADLKAVSEAGA